MPLGIYITSFTATLCTQRIIDEFNVLRLQPEIIRNAAVRHMHKQTILCVDQNGDMLNGIMVHSSKFYANNRLLNYFGEGKMKILPSFMFNSFKFPEV